ncbi:M23 family metallopeptidase [Marivita hallyeonensis]|uniref:Peptidase family M23 n=1 Tax=Marivita hallyeonensis TaxID=996342 RepID=A0A1M5XEX4_9RHOB|nr:M23 family metallopeptidase [Marivita hallyeonensis]SHH98370.1 Peptidase family M23 [Marivita hallyeonensis]
MKTIWLIVFATLVAWALPANQATADVTCDEDFGMVCIETVTNDAQITFIAENRHALLPVTVDVEMNLQNLRLAGGGSGPFVLQGREKVQLFTLTTASQGGWSYRYTFSWSRGDITARHDDSYRYRLPYGSDQSFPVGQSCNGRFSHIGPQKYAMDFDMPVGTPILATREGRVVAVKEDSNRGGPSRSYENDGNYVIVAHGDRTLAQYFHLRQNGIAVQLGDTVRRGQLLGYSGNTGRSTGPHLHFEVIKGARGVESETVPVRFATSAGPVQCPRQGSALKAVP